MTVVVDTSALVSLLEGEADAAQILAALTAAEARKMSAFNVLETHVAMTRKKGPRASMALDALLLRTRIEIVALTAEHLALARDAATRFGKGRHAAKLNLGDCCAYALARHEGVPLLAKGDDFPRTDVTLVPL